MIDLSHGSAAGEQSLEGRNRPIELVAVINSFNRKELLERALISFMLDVHTQEHGYTEILPPYLARRSMMVGAGQLPKFEEDVYACTEDELYLNPTAEVPLVGLHSDSILPPHTLPLHYVAWTTAFRREAGSTLPALPQAGRPGRR